jgi:Cu-Zn family superoxide dismutase
MKKISYLALALTLCLASCKNDKKENKTVEQEIVKKEVISVIKVTAALNAKSDSNVSGNVVFTEESGTVNMVATMSGLAPGEHAIHIHASSDCTSTDGSSAGGHWNPTNQPHGKWGDQTGYHKGDIGNFMADEAGNATVNFSTDAWCIECDDDTKNIIGKGIIVHAGTDDFKSQPSGAAGARVSCAGIIE